MKHSVVLTLTFFLSLFCACPLAAQDSAEASGNDSPAASNRSGDLHHYAHVDTIRGRLAASGMGEAAERFSTPDAIRRAACLAAELDARRKLVELADGFGLNSTTVIRDYAPESDVSRAESAGSLGPVAVDNQTMTGPRTCRVTISADIPRKMRRLLPQVIDPMEPTSEIRAPMMDRPD